MNTSNAVVSFSMCAIVSAIAAYGIHQICESHVKNNNIKKYAFHEIYNDFTKLERRLNKMQEQLDILDKRDLGDSYIA